MAEPEPATPDPSTPALPPSPSTVTVTTTGTGAGGPRPEDTLVWGRSIDTLTRGVVAIILALAVSWGFLQGMISGEGFVPIVMAAFAWYAMSRPASPPGSTEVKTTTPSNGPPRG